MTGFTALHRIRAFAIAAIMIQSPVFAEMFPAPIADRWGSYGENGSIIIEVDKFVPALETAFVPGASDVSLPAGDSPAEFSWLYRVGGTVPGFTFSPGMHDAAELRFDLGASMTFLSAEAPDGFWGFLASAYYSNITPRFSLELAEDMAFFLAFRHSCKHDIDTGRRLVIEQALGLGYQAVFFRAPDAEFLTQGLFGAYAEYLLPAGLPGQPENDRSARLAIHGEADLLRLGKDLMLWSLIHGGFSFIPRSRGAASGVRFDARVELGLEIGTWSTYLGFRRISDPMIESGSPGLMGLSFGLRLSSAR
jgi:hypothetical protein